MRKLINLVDFSSPANFSIEVNGFLDENLSDYLGGLTISHKTLEGKIKTSYLIGEVVDQAALIGIINSLYDMRYAILRVEIISDKSKKLESKE